MSDAPDFGRLAQVVYRDIGINVPGLLEEAEKIPERIQQGKRMLQPLKAELDALRERYQARAQQPSQADLERRILLSELMEEIRVLYNRNPEYRENSKGGETKVELTDGRAENKAHGHPRYAAYVQKMAEERKRMADLHAQCRKLYDRIDYYKMRLSIIRDKLKQAEGLEYAWSAEARLTPR